MPVKFSAKFILLLWSIVLVTLHPASAATFTVNQTLDNGDGTCDATCTLRDAVGAANADVDADTIVFDGALAGQTINLTTVGDTSFGPAALLVSSNITIQGLLSVGVTITRSNVAPSMRLFSVLTGASLTLRNLTLSGGSARGSNGGSGSGFTGGGAAGLGGAVFNAGTLTLEGSTLFNNQAIGGNGGPIGAAGNTSTGGGGLATNGSSSFGGAGGGPNGGTPGSFTIAGGNGGFGGGGGGGASGGDGGFGAGGGAGPTGGNGGFGGGGGGGAAGGAGGFGAGNGGSGNAASSGGGRGAGMGGAIFNFGGTLNLTNSTLSGNTAQGGLSGSGNGQGLGGAIFNLNGDAAVRNSTLNANIATAGGGLYLLAQGGSAGLSLRNSIIANSITGVDVVFNVLSGSGSFTEGGSNLVERVAGNITVPGVLLTSDPQLGPLQNNGGPTPTHAPSLNSPVLDRGTNYGLNTDQRGLPRPVDLTIVQANIFNGDASDIGAVEIQSPGTPQSGNTLVVSVTDDSNDGSCTVEHCSLREAMLTADAQPNGASPDTITFASTLSGTIQLTTALPMIFDSVTITGLTNTRLTVRGEGAADPYSLITNSSSTTVTISNLTFSNGQASTGGGIRNDGTMFLTNCTITGNAVVASQGSASGGGIFNDARMTITNCTISDNSASHDGGGIQNDGSSLTIINSTISGNSAANGGGLSNERITNLTNTTFSGNTATNSGGAIYNYQGSFESTINVTNSTISGNAASNGGGIFNVASATANLRNSIVAGNTAPTNPNVSGTLATNTNNITSGTAAEAGLETNGQGQPILKDNGGPTATIALLFGSPAIDRSGPSSPPTDQRGLPRPIDFNTLPNASGGNGSDIGAFEFQAQFNGTPQSGGTLTVNVTDDINDNSCTDAHCSLREAILAANALPNGGTPDTIAFNIPGAGVQTINVGSGGNGALPGVTDAVVINGYSQPGSSPNTLATGNNAVLRIELNGAGAGAGASGITLVGVGSSIIRGLVINRFSASGIFITSNGGNSNNILSGNFIGTNVNGTAAAGNGNGVFISGATNNIIGGTVTGVGNLISGNTTDGVVMSNANGNLVQGNLIGTNASGTAVLGNPGSAVRMENAVNNVIGGTAPGARNIISGNGFGVSIIGSGIIGSNAGGNQIQGNYIGTDINGTTDLGNVNGGVIIFHAANNGVGSTSPAARNIISGNNSIGVRIGGSVATGNVVQGNYIGTDVSGTQDLGNTTVGVHIGDDASNNFVGSTITGTGNLISGNNNAGVQLLDAHSNLVQGNRVGVQNDGVTALGNAVHGIVVNGTSTNNLIGGASGGNIIAHNIGNGVFIDRATGNRILNNSIFSNSNLGIELLPEQVTANDPGDLDGGANNLQNYPVLTEAVTFGSTTTIRGTLNSTPNSAFTIQYFSNDNPDPSGFGEGRAFIGQQTAVTTDDTGNALISFNPSTAVPLGQFITATATNNTTGDTSEFSNAVTVVIPGVFQFSAPTYSINETGPTATITVTRTGSVGGTATVNYATSNGTANAGSDFTTTGDTLIFNNGETSKTFSVPITGDSLDEPDETVNLTLSNPTGTITLGGQATAVLTIVDINNAPTLAVNDVTVTEGNSGTINAIFTVTLSAVSGKSITVDFGTTNGTATAGPDYQSRTGSLTFVPGEVTKTITVLVNSDGLDEADETFSVLLTDPVNATFADAQGVATIADDDATPTLSINDRTVVEGNRNDNTAIFTVTLAFVSNQTVTVNYSTASFSALANADFVSASGTLTFAPGETSKTISVAVNDDTFREGDEAFEVNLTNPVNATLTKSKGVGIITDDDTAALTLTITPGAITEGAGSAATGTVTRNTPTNQALTVSLKSSNTYEITVPERVIIPAGQGSASFPITVVDDTGVDGTETVNITASFPEFIAGVASVTVLDNDVLTPPTYSLALSVTPASFSEGAGEGAARGVVTLNAPRSNDTTVTLQSSDSGEAQPATNSITIPAGATTAEFVIDAGNDGVVDGAQSVTLTATANDVAPGSATVIVTDNDRGALTLLIRPSSFSEGAGATAATGLVQRNTPTRSALTVNLFSSDATEAIVPARVTIPAGALATSFPIRAVNDSLADGPQRVRIRATAGGIVAGEAHVTVLDNEPVSRLSISGRVTTSSTNEAGPAPQIGVGGVTVSLFTGNTLRDVTTTDASGVYRFINLPPGNYNVRVQRTDYRFNTARREVGLLLQSARDINFAGVPLASIGGRVLRRGADGSRQGIAGITVTARGPVGVQTARTNSLGYYRFNGLRLGTYLVLPLLRGTFFQPPVRSLVLTPSAPLAANVDFVADGTDSTSPTVTITGPQPGSYNTQTQPTVATGGARDAGGAGVASVTVALARFATAVTNTPTAFYRWDIGGFVATDDPLRVEKLAQGTGVWTLRGLPALPPGFYGLRATATDAAGKVTRSGIVRFRIVASPAASANASNTGTVNASSVALSTATAQASSNSIKLRFAGALDAESAGDPAHYAVQVNGRAVAVESAAYDATQRTVILSLPEGSLHSGDKVTVRWVGVLDAQGNNVTGQTGVVTAR